MSLAFCAADNKMLWPADNGAAAGGDGELAGADRLNPDVPVHPELSLGRAFSDGRTQDTMTMLLPSLPSLSAHPHKGEVWSDAQLKFLLMHDDEPFNKNSFFTVLFVFSWRRLILNPLQGY